MFGDRAGAKRLWLSLIFCRLHRTVPVGAVGENVMRFCGRDENGTVISEPYPYSYCEDPWPEYTSKRGYSAGTVFTGTPQFGPKSGHVSYFQVGDVGLGYSCDGVLLIESMSRIMRPRETPYAGSNEYRGAEDVEDGRSTWGWYGPPPRVEIRCIVEPIPLDVDFTNITTTHHVRHGKVTDCTMCEEASPFDCPIEFDRWYLDSALTFRDGNICDETYGSNRENSSWFGYTEQYYLSNMAVWFAFNGRVAELGRNHPFFPGYYCPDDEGNCPCSLPAESPVYPDSLYGGDNPTFDLPVELSGFPSHSRRLGQRLSGCDGPAIVQAVFKLSADDSWDLDPTVEYRAINETMSMGLNDLRNDVLTPAVYIPDSDAEPPLPKMGGLMNPGLLRYRDDNVTLIRCLIEPNEEYDNEADQAVHGAPTNCVSCVYSSRQESACVAPNLTNGSSEWIIDIVTGFQQYAFVPGVTVPPGFTLTLAAYNATSDTEAARAVLPSTALPAEGYSPDEDPSWVPFKYRHIGPP